ncbi:hypothetical protein SacmaDRAFT_5118 [Saccharomonospora marina XMU15]|uniref:G domain-containing protein n=1 Tax=Saccharomonospora marina XMU15 TaxID=882083 RepID=H5X414_9PSEU|nr:GTPase [Saccharomonospora marina]EHR53285.1 hypothetical protein SacmaDRAFT_5118 [Saccharomonospora marina XMU15]
MNLPDRAWTLLNQALDVYADSPRAINWLRRHLARFTDPLRLAVVGGPATGKSTLVNAIAGECVATEGGQGMAWYQVPPARSQSPLTLIDTPAVGPDMEPGAVESICMEADAVLYLMGHPHNADLAFLRAVQDHPVARVAAVNSVAVLSRADELGGGRVDALISARQVARKYRKEGELSVLCQDVIAVAGLAASGGRTLSDDEFELLAGLAAAPKEELEPLLLSADRFAADPERERLLGRFGLFGIRLAVTLIRRGADTRAALSTQLAQRSGLGDLRDAISLYFTDRAPVLKARSALIGLDVVLRMEPRPSAAPLVGELERTLAGAHEFHELRLLATVSTGRVRLPEELREEAIRLAGGYGLQPQERLGAQVQGPPLRQAAAAALRVWRAYSENPVFGAAERHAARTVARSCEALITEPAP